MKDGLKCTILPPCLVLFGENLRSCTWSTHGRAVSVVSTRTLLPSPIGVLRMKINAPLISHIGSFLSPQATLRSPAISIHSWILQLERFRIRILPMHMHIITDCRRVARWTQMSYDIVRQQVFSPDDPTRMYEHAIPLRVKEVCKICVCAPVNSEGARKDQKEPKPVHSIQTVFFF